MKKIWLIVACCVLALFAFVGCSSSDTSGSAKLYITECSLPGDGSGMIPGTFTLPNGTKVPLGSVVQEGNWLYTSGSAKVVDQAANVDYLASSEQARMVCREALSNYLNATVAAGSSRSSENVNGKNSTSSSTESKAFSSATLTGMEDCGYCLSPDGTSYVLARINLNNVDEIETASKKASQKAEQYGDMAISGFLNKLFR